MRKNEIVVGGHYVAKVANKITTVRVDKIEEVSGGPRPMFGRTPPDKTIYSVTNLATGRHITFRSAAKFRSEAKPTPSKTTDAMRERGYSDAELLDQERLHGKPADAYQLDEEGNEVPALDPQGREGELMAAEPQEEAKATVDPTSAQQATQSSASAPAACQSQLDAPTATLVCALPAGRCGNPVEGDEQRRPFADAAIATPSTSPTPSLAGALASSGLADRLAQTMVAAPRKHPLTDEQQAILDAAPNEQVLVIEAGAGAGKTSTLVAMAERLGGRGQYTAFNSALVAESKTKFPHHCAANTIHSLAFRSEGNRFAHRLNGGRTRSSEVAAILGIGPLVVRGADDKPKTLDGGLLASMARRAVKQFCQSDAKQIDGWFFGKTVATGVNEADQETVRAYLLPFAQRMWEDATDVNGKLPYDHAYYLKTWELNHPVISADYLLIDERQDLSRVMLSIAKQQVKLGLKVVLVGDAAQAIYGFLGCVDAATAFPDAKKLYLSTSFRFGPAVASVANSILSRLQQRTELVLKGFDKIPSRLASIDSPDAVLCRTNAGAVGTLLQAIADGKRPHLVGGGSDVLAFVRGAQDLKKGKRTEHPELTCFESWGEVQAYVKLDEGADLKLMTNLIDKFGVDKIASALRSMPDEKEADLVVSTCHKAKGKEWGKVRLASDFMPLEKMGDEELRLLYVAATRAQHVLDVESSPPFCGNPRRNEHGDIEELGSREHDMIQGNVRDTRMEVIDLTEARRLSKLIVDKPEIIVAHRGEANGIITKEEPTTAKPRMNAGFSWTKSDKHGWLVRGPVGSKGKVVVSRRNGSTSEEMLGKAVWQDAEVALYQVSK